MRKNRGKNFTSNNIKLAHTPSPQEINQMFVHMIHLCLEYVLCGKGAVIPAPKSVMNDRTSIVTASHHLQLSSRCIRSNSAKQRVVTLYPDKSRSLLKASLPCDALILHVGVLDFLILINLEHMREPASCNYRPPRPQNRHKNESHMKNLNISASQVSERLDDQDLHAQKCCRRCGYFLRQETM